jgi:nucleoside-triphosphatase THEP1
LEEEQIITKLEESKKNDFGDIGRTQYIIEKLEKRDELPKSDYLYIDRMIEMCESIIVEIPQESEIVFENILSEDLTKCNICNIEINLDEKSIRKNDFWFHTECFEKIPILKQDVKQKTKLISPPKSPVRVIQKSTTVPQMIFSGGLLASLVGTTYLLAGEIISTVIGICGSVIFFTIFKSQIKSKNIKNSEITIPGIIGFDSLTSGLKKNSSVMVSGPPGSGKTTFGLQFICAGAKDYDEPGVYISLSQSIDEIKNDCKSIGLNIDELILKNKILMIDLRPFKIKDKVIGKDDSLYRGEQIPFEHLTKFILNSIKKIKAKRIVIDSISTLGMQYSDKFYMRQGLQGMIQSLENFNVTSILISEFSENKKNSA